MTKAEKCCDDPTNHSEDKFKDTLTTSDGCYYTVYLKYCKVCHKVIEDGTWVE